MWITPTEMHCGYDLSKENIGGLTINKKNSKLRFLFEFVGYLQYFSSLLNSYKTNMPLFFCYVLSRNRSFSSFMILPAHFFLSVYTAAYACIGCLSNECLPRRKVNFAQTVVIRHSNNEERLLFITK